MASLRSAFHLRELRRYPRGVPTRFHFDHGIPADTINESIIARASAKNPQGATKLQELEEIRAMHVTVAGIAEATVREVLEG